MEGLQFGGFDAMANGVIRMVHADAQPAKLFLHWQHLKLAFSLIFDFRGKRLQILE
jgi:hypothetical protein